MDIRINMDIDHHPHNQESRSHTSEQGWQRKQLLQQPQEIDQGSDISAPVPI